LSWAESRICQKCRADFRLPPDRILPGGVPAIAAFAHTGVAARMMHALKYRGVDAILDPAIEVLRPRLPRGHAFVAVPRVWSRFARYGVDPAAELAHRLANATGGSVERPLTRPLHSIRRAGNDHDRAPTHISLRVPVNKPVIVVDDVLTTGSTVLGLIATIGLEMTSLVVTATSALRVRGLSPPWSGPT
jgi:predicted amidophosphoribosyltransferase